MVSDDLPFPELVADAVSAEVRLILGIPLEYICIHGPTPKSSNTPTQLFSLTFMEFH